MNATITITINIAAANMLDGNSGAKIIVLAEALESVYSDGLQARAIDIEALVAQAHQDYRKNNEMKPYGEAVYQQNVHTFAAATLGSMTSERKAASSRENGKKGGRPRKAE